MIWKKQYESYVMRKFIFLDTETTGGGEEDRICQLGFIEFSKEGCFVHQSYCKPPLPISLGAMAVHNITNEKIENEPRYEHCEAAQKLNELNDGYNIAIIHNAPFDVAMLQKEGIEWKGKVIDTLRCSRHLFPELESHALQYLRYALGVYKREEEEAQSLGIVITAHDAIGDVFILKLVFEELFEKSGRDMLKLLELTERPVFKPIWRWGKHKDKRLSDIAMQDPAYLDWAIANMTLDDDWIFSCYFVQAQRAFIKPRPQDEPYLAWAEQNQEFFKTEE